MGGCMGTMVGSGVLAEKVTKGYYVKQWVPWLVQGSMCAGVRTSCGGGKLLSFNLIQQLHQPGRTLPGER